MKYGRWVFAKEFELVICDMWPPSLHMEYVRVIESRSCTLNPIPKIYGFTNIYPSPVCAGAGAGRQAAQ